MKPRFPQGPCLYGILSREHSRGRSMIETTRALLAAGVAIIQYREKNLPLDEQRRECLSLRAVTRAAGALFIINDHALLAAEAEADGLHLGQGDMPVPDARAIVGRNMLIGLSTQTPAQALRAQALGADYIGVGPVFATSTKEDAGPALGLEYLDFTVRRIDLPQVALGGIQLNNLRSVLERGIRCVAMISGIIGAQDIGAAVKEAQAILNEFADIQPPAPSRERPFTTEKL